MLDFLKKIFGNKSDKDVKELLPIIEEINEYFEEYNKLTDEEVQAKTLYFKGIINDAAHKLEEEKTSMEEKLKSPDFLVELESLHADLQVVVAFRMLPEVVWKMPSLGTFNLHASLLPQYRGAAPINHAIINGMKTTGVTTFFLDEKIDTGKIMYRESIEIEDHDNAGSLHDKLMIMGAELVKKTVDDIAIGNFQTTSQQSYLQNDEKLLEAPKIFKEFCKIDWNNSVVELNNFIRGLSPYPTAYTTIHNHDSKAFLLKIFKTKMDKTSPLSGLPGAIKTDNKKILSFECTDGFLIIEELQLEGKKRMTTEEFLKGFRLNETK